MQRNEAIAFLITCKPLANRLLLQGINMALTNEDRAVITRYSKVQLEDWVDYQDICQQAGLVADEIGILNLIAIMVRKELMRRQHASGEQLDT